MRFYYQPFWEIYGVTPLTIWDLDYGDFIQMTIAVEQIRREASKPK